MARPDWYLDWSDDAVAIIATGPSAKKADIGALKGRLPVIAIKEAVDLAPFADVVYGCDAAWWNHRQGLQKFTGLKVAWSGGQINFPGISRVDLDDSQKHIRQDEDKKYRLLFDQPGKIGAGGNSGFQALNLALQFGANRVLLIGYDMTDRSGVHWYGRNFWMNANNPDESNFRRWRATFNACVPDLNSRGIQVINTSPYSALTCFGRGTIEQALAGWGL